MPAGSRLRQRREMLNRPVNVKRIIILSALALVQALNMVAVHLLIGSRFIDMGGLVAKVLGFGSSGAFSFLLSVFGGGLVVFGITKITDILAVLLCALKYKLAAGVIPAVFMIVHAVAALIVLAFGTAVYWGYPALAYLVGLLAWALTVKWRTEIAKIKQLIKEIKNERKGTGQ